MSAFQSFRGQALRLTFRASSRLSVAVIAASCVCALTAPAANSQALTPGNLVVSRSVYTDTNSVKVGDILPPNCASTTGGCSPGTGAIAGSNFPFVFNNDVYDASFGITSKILLDQITVTGTPVSTLEVPNSTDTGVTPTSDQLVTSFSSKSEMALHLSTNREYLSFMGYHAPVGAVDVSNSNTPGAVDPTNPVGQNFYRGTGIVSAAGKFFFTLTNAYSGNNGRSAVLNSAAGVFYTAGNAGNGSNPQPTGVVLGAGTQFIRLKTSPESTQTVQAPTPVGSFSVTELGDKSDKIGKDDNFRGLALYNNVLYYTKGSGSNGVNTVYFLDTTGTACPKGVGLPVPGAALPTAPLSVNAATLETKGLSSNMCILAGFPTALAKSASPVAFPFGLWFANPTTLYVADEGDGSTSGDFYTHAAAQTTAGLQKWIFNSEAGEWQLAYVLQTGLALGTPYTVSGYPTGTNSATGLNWSPATDGLRNITGLVGDGTYPELPVGKVAIFGISSTVSGGGDQGADPNKLFVVIDELANTTPSVAAKESFATIKYAKYGEVLRGVAFTPGSTNITSY